MNSQPSRSTASASKPHSVTTMDKQHSYTHWQGWEVWQVTPQKTSPHALPAKRKDTMTASRLTQEQIKSISLTGPASDEIGSGTYGDVYKVSFMRSMLAVKVSKPPKQKRNGKYSPSAANKYQEAKKEAELGMQLHHPNIVKTLGMHCSPTQVFIVMPLYAQSLSRRIRSSVPIRTEERESILNDVIDGLDYMHKKGILHGDLKPGNVFLNIYNQACLGDFGMSCSRDNPNSLPAPSDYMAPELSEMETYINSDGIQEQRLSPKTVASDIFGAGFTLYSLYTKRNWPYAWTLKENVPVIDLYVPNTPEGRAIKADPVFNRVISRCIKHIPTHRPESTTEIKAVLDHIQQEKMTVKSQQRPAFEEMSHMARQAEALLLPTGLLTPEKQKVSPQQSSSGTPV
ncbi:serine/threonine protein kinase [Sansalvadorimonas verongulae]|uniref:serine/threonine protein kinase n=1 Tax=Sansalvadorimonas verongulae TaxID=2172824 RepID=UPI0012BB70F9|nr:protein kinase family protein [Sansalvadorimonas verongulae]MTI13387.1 protein kinase family protein [Sansalvadorimonas verongulae]